MKGASGARDIERVLERFSLDDSVVIRRQDLTAAPVLGVYAGIMAALVKTLRIDPHANQEFVSRLQDIGDLFDRQAAAAADEGYKMPD